MRISFQRGDIKNLITTGVIYFAAVFFLPTLLPQTLSVHLRLNIALGLSTLATIIKCAFAIKYCFRIINISNYHYVFHSI